MNTFIENFLKFAKEHYVYPEIRISPSYEWRNDTANRYDMFIIFSIFSPVRKSVSRTIPVTVSDDGVIIFFDYEYDDIFESMVDMLNEK